jgi:hypothetical protein
MRTHFAICCLVVVIALPAIAKRKPARPARDLSALRDEYNKATADYKASLEKLLALYLASERKAEDNRFESEVF